MTNPRVLLRSRVAQDTQLLLLLTTLSDGSAAVVPDWPADTLQPSDCPRVTFFLPSGGNLHVGLGDIDVQFDIWVYRGVGGGGQRVHDIDHRLNEIFSGADWIHDPGGPNHAACHTEVGRFRDFPAPSDKPMRRMRRIRLSVN